MAIRLTALTRRGIAATLVVDDQVQTVAKKNPGAAGLLAGLVLAGLAAGSAFGAAEAVLRIEMDKQRPQVVFLSWNTEDGSRAATNLLRSGAPMCLRWPTVTASFKRCSCGNQLSAPATIVP